MNNEIHISSAVVQVLPDNVEDLAIFARRFSKVEIPLQDKTGKIILVLTTDSEKEVAELLDVFRDQEGVISVSLVYHQVEETETIDEEVA